MSDWTGNPNSGHQRWSKWTFHFLLRSAEQPALDYVRDNARRFFAHLFRTTAGRVRVTQFGRRWTVELQVEGVDVHDPQVQTRVRQQFARDFVRNGFRKQNAWLLRMEAALIAGSREDGTPCDQLIVMPMLSLKEH